MYTETQLQKLIADVEKEFTAHLAKAEEEKTSLAKSENAVEQPTSTEPLAKAEDGEKKPEKKPEAKEGKEEGEKKPESSEAKPEGEKAPEGKEGEAKPEGEKAPEGEHKPEGQAAAPAEGGQHDYDQEDMEHLDKMYMSMSKAELVIHHDAVRKALDSMNKCGDMSMSKSETVTSTAPAATAAVEVKTETAQQPNKEVELLKSELAEANKKVAQESAKSEGLQKNLDAVSAFLTKLVEKKVAPAAKAITSLDVIAKSEGGQDEKSLSKSEIDAALLKKAQDPKLAKSDRDAINAFYLNGGSINSISHLLK